MCECAAHDPSWPQSYCEHWQHQGSPRSCELSGGHGHFQTHPLNITSTIPQPTHRSQSVAESCIYRKRWVWGILGEVFWIVHQTSKRSDHNHTAAKAVSQQWSAAHGDVSARSLLSRRSLWRSKWRDGYAWGPAVLLFCAFGLSLFKEQNICVTGRETAKHLLYVFYNLFSENGLQMTFMFFFFVSVWINRDGYLKQLWCLKAQHQQPHSVSFVKVKEWRRE